MITHKKIKFESTEQVEEFLGLIKEDVVDFSKELGDEASRIKIRKLSGAIKPSELVEEYAKVHFDIPNAKVVLKEEINEDGLNKFSIIYFANLRKNKAKLPYMGLEQSFCFTVDQHGFYKLNPEDSEMSLVGKEEIKELNIKV